MNNKTLLIRPQLKSDSGQAMAEFVILLTIIMLLCSGMLFSSRLLTFDFWAQQEARYLAFEQTWVPHWAHLDPYDDPVTELDNDSKYRRPNSVRRIQNDAEKEVNDEGSVTDLIGFWSWLTPEERTVPEAEPPTMFARSEKSIWEKKTSEWRDADVSLLRSAWATSDMDRFDGLLDGGIEDRPPDSPYPFRAEGKEELSRNIHNLLVRGDFGEKMCSAMDGFFSKRKRVDLAAHFRDDGCADRFDQGFADHLADNVHFMDMFRDYAEQIDWGLEPREAFQTTLELVVANQFYSFFDTTVKGALIGGVAYLEGGRIGNLALGFDQSLIDMIGDARYLGSSVAIGLISTAIETCSLFLPTHNADTEKAFEDALNTIMHVDAASFFGDYVPAIDNGFFLNPTYLPVPPYFGQVAGSLFSGLMENVLSKEDGSAISNDDIDEELIDESNKMAVVNYPAQNGLFYAAYRRWDSDRTLTSRFYLVTQPWHITRRVSPNGPFREYGNQFEEWDEDSSEAFLRKRTEGLWLFPSNIAALASPLTDLLPGSLGGIVDVFEGFGSIIGDLKEFIFTSNPILSIVNELNQIEGFRSFIPSLPIWPVARPTAYPGSTELVGNDGADDEMMGEVRDFEDYVDEQEAHDPDPAPEFND